jgi:hypothetical protein
MGGESPLKRWLLLDGHRLHIAGLLAGVGFGAVVVLQATGGLRPRDPAAVVRLLAALVGGTLPFITIVLAINSSSCRRNSAGPRGFGSVSTG